MNRKYVLFVLLFTLLRSGAGFGQNLVPNPSFEDYILCPDAVIQIERATGWLNFGNSPDYFNSCSSTMNVPNSGFGYQNAHTGSAFAGCATYALPFSPAGPNYREFIGTQLTQQLLIGTKYFLSFYVNFSYHPTWAIASNKLGLKFSTIAYDSCCPPAINNLVHMVSDTIYSDSIGWVRINGSFIADSAYNYVIIGNFFDDSNTDTLNLGNFPAASYYYIDDVCVSIDSIYNEVWTNIFSINNKNALLLYPNPANEIINIVYTDFINSYEIYDINGKLILNEYNLKLKDIQIPINYLSEGLFLIQITSKKHIYTKHFYKTQ